MLSDEIFYWGFCFLNLYFVNVKHFVTTQENNK
jgi:hypothetical protein